MAFENKGYHLDFVRKHILDHLKICLVLLILYAFRKGACGLSYQLLLQPRRRNRILLTVTEIYLHVFV